MVDLIAILTLGIGSDYIVISPNFVVIQALIGYLNSFYGYNLFKYFKLKSEEAYQSHRSYIYKSYKYNY